MAGTFFAPAANIPQLFLASPGPGAGGPRLAFLLPRVAKPPAGAVGLLELWGQQPAGCLIFLGAGLSDDKQAAFASAAWRYLAQPRPSLPRIAWLDQPDDAGRGLRGRLIAATPAGTTDQLRSFDFGGYALQIGGGCTIAPSADGDAVEIMPSGRGHLWLSLPDGGRFSAVGGARFVLAGAQAGCAQFELTLAGADVRRLKAELRVLVRDRAFPADDEAFFLKPLRYPLLSETDDDWRDHFGVPVRLNVCLDLLAPLDGERSYLAFAPIPADANYTMPSCYRTNMGYTVHLAPRDERSRLVFAHAPVAQAADGVAGDALYLTPAGEFELSVPRYDGSTPTAHDNLLCGLAGMEYVRLAPGDTTIIIFTPGNAAYAPTFDPAAPKPPPADAVALAPSATTAWAGLRRASGQLPMYYAQPDQAPLYKPPPSLSDDPATTQDDLLQFFEVPAATLPAPNGTAHTFPLLPYGGVRPDGVRDTRLADYQLMEERLVTPLRRRLIHDQGGKVGDAPQAGVLGDNSIIGTTPQGLLASFSANYTLIETLTLLSDAPTAPGSSRELQLLNIGDGTNLRTALQSSQLFLVATDPEALKPFLADGSLRISDWGFDLNPSLWDKHDTILIFKFCGPPPDKQGQEAQAWSLEKLAENVQSWALPAQFNSSVSTARVRLSGILQEAIAKAGQDATPKDREYYGPLARAAIDPGWSGVLALNVPLAPTGIPQQLGGLSAGIDRTKLFARYLGSTTTPILHTGGVLSVGRSSLFGLIDYQNSQAPLHADADYDFQVTKLQVLFYNSQLRAFASEVQLTLDSLFGERSALIGGAGRNILLLKGSAEDHDGKVTYAFGFSGSNRFATPASSALREVEIIRAQFATDPGRASAQPIVTSGRFTFWGRLVFRRQPTFDALSFGGDELSTPSDAEQDAETSDAPAPDGPPPAASYLSFANLLLLMRFEQDSPNDAPRNLTFAFEPRNLAIDIQRSPARPQSLFAKFPLKFTGLLVSAGEKSADEYSFMPVKAPGAGKLASNWYGLTYDLELGSLGALAGNGKLVATLLVAWSPGKEPKGPYIGLKLPGSTGGKREITIQGILKLIFKSIELSAGVDNSGVVSYLLKLKNIKLKFFVLSLPPSGQSEIIIFGNPNGTTDDKTVGWYAAYAK